jgi:hypothetical protein
VISINLISVLVYVIVLGIGGLGGYWLRKRIDTKESSRDSRIKARFDDKRMQLDLLLEFLGAPANEFKTLQCVGNTWDEVWRRERARTVSEWVERYRPRFPEDIQRALTGFANMAGTMTVEHGLELGQRPQSIEATQVWITTIKSYVGALRNELGLDA